MHVGNVSTEGDCRAILERLCMQLVCVHLLLAPHTPQIRPRHNHEPIVRDQPLPIERSVADTYRFYRPARLLRECDCMRSNARKWTYDGVDVTITSFVEQFRAFVCIGRDE